MKERRERGIVRWLALLTPVFEIGLFVWIFFLYRTQALHPSHWPFTILVLMIVTGIFAQLVILAGSLWTKEERVQQLKWLTFVLLPVLAAVWLPVRSQWGGNSRLIPRLIVGAVRRDS